MKTPLAVLAFGLVLLNCAPAEPTCGCPRHTDVRAQAPTVVVADIGAAEAERLDRDREGVRTSFQLDGVEVERGKRPGRPWSPGGTIGSLTHLDSRSISLEPGRRYRLYLDASERVLLAEPFDDPDSAESGGSGGTTASGFLEGASGVPGRFLFPDQGRPLEYVVDADALPTGITQEQALAAVEAAFSAWSSATAMRFHFGGVQSFGTGASSAHSGDKPRLYIQLHDLYGEITSSSTLGIGGRSLTIHSYNSGGGGGGTIGGLAFHEASHGYVVIKHTTPQARNATTLAEILTHEIGHALGLAHSSEDPSEPDPEKMDAIMYYSIHGNGRGATLGTWDIATLRTGYPVNDTAPFAVDRTIVGSNTQVVPGVNQIPLLARDASQTSGDLSVQLEPETTSDNGSFSLSGKSLTFTFHGNYGEFVLSDEQILQGYYYDRCIFRVSDGTNLSPHYVVRVVGNVASPSATLAAPELAISTAQQSLTWTTEKFKTYEVQVSREGQPWTTKELRWATGTSAESPAVVEDDCSRCLIRVRAHP